MGRAHRRGGPRTQAWDNAPDNGPFEVASYRFGVPDHPPTLAGLDTAVNGHADALIATLAFAQRWTSRIDWSSLDTATAELEATHALLDATDAEAEGMRLRMPDA